jgi:hypothetical protein
MASFSDRRVRWGLLIAALGGLVALGVWLWRPPAVDMIAVLHANNRGIGLMEQFKYPEAAAAFAEALRLAPDWRPGQVNHAIALLNQNKPETLAQALQTFEAVLRTDPDNPHAHYCLGIILQYQGKEIDRAGRAFEAVTRLDPADAHAWYFLGRVRLDQEKNAEARACFEKALECNPYLIAALNNLQLLQRAAGQNKEADELLARFQKLNTADWYTKADVKYGEMGRYADVVGRVSGPAGASIAPLPLFRRDEKLHIEVAAPSRWATAKDFGSGAEADLLRAVRGRFGGTLVVLDYDRDGQPDLLLLAAVTEGERVRDLLLHNEGQGRFRDVTAVAGLGGARYSLGATVADFDNDGYPDLLVTTTAGPRLWRNRAGKDGRRFEEVTRVAGLDQVQGICLGAAFVDIDQDGDLDLLLARSAPNVASALTTLKDAAASKETGPLLLLNVGVAPPAAGKDAPPLEAKFRLATEHLPALALPAVNLLVSDLDSDRDIDVLVFGDGHAPTMILNDRLLAFHPAALPGAAAGKWNGGLVLDADQDERSDLFLLGPGQAPLLLLQRGKDGFQPGSANAPPLLQAVAADVDSDGWADVIGLSEQRKPILLHNDGTKLVRVLEGLGADAGWPADLIALAAVDTDGDCFPDLVAWSESQGLLLQGNAGNGNHGLRLELTGRHDKGVGLRTNSDAIGTRVTARTPRGQPGAEVATASAGLGQSRVPLLLGLGRFAQADVVSVRWPDGTWQAELNVSAGQPTLISETNRKPVSCPILFAWDGRTYGFVGDILGAGSIGECLPGGKHRQPRPEESVKIEGRQLVAKEGRYLLKFAEPMDEVTYLDRLQLLVIDHPAEMRVYPDERFLADPRTPLQDLLAFASAQQVFPREARDHRGRDMTQVLRDWDRITADGFAQRAWLGYAEEHSVELDFGDRLAQFGPGDKLGLFLAGWTDYPFPESIWAATQADVALQAPRLERLDAEGRWQTILPELGFPAGLPRMMTADVRGLLGGPSCRLRIRTNMHVYWDQVFIAPIRERVAADGTGKSMRVTRRDVQAARLEVRGCVQEYTPDGREPTLFDYDRLDRVPVTRLSGRLTRLGDVTELLHERDDRFAIFGPGDELSVAFDATGLPELPAGWTRSYVLRTWGYCKDASPFTATGGTVEPLPFAGMSGFPYGPNEHYPRTPRHTTYLRNELTRPTGTAR